MSDLTCDSVNAILATADKFAERELAPTVRERESGPPAATRELARRAAEIGLLSLSAPEDLGGCGLPSSVWALVIERIAAADAGFAALMLAHALASEAVLRSPLAELKERALAATPPTLLAYPSYLDPEAPEDLVAARKTEQGYVLNGTARRLANAPIADAAVVAASLEGEPALLLVRLTEPRPAPVNMLGLRACPVGHLALADALVPAPHLLAAGKDALRQLHDRFIPAATAIAIAAMKASLDYAVTYGQDRYQGGKMIIDHSQLRMMYGRIASEHAVLRQAWLHGLDDDPAPAGRLSVKALAADLAVRAAMDGIQLLGGYGYTADFPQERRLRDARQAAQLLGSPPQHRLDLAAQLIAGD
jgi:butyryl-CoA dehydrogenase